MPDSAYASLQLSAIAQARFDDAIYLGEKYYTCAEKRKDYRAIFQSLVNMMEIYIRKGDYTKSFYFAEKLLEISNASGNSAWRAESGWAMGRLNMMVGNHLLALKYYRIASSLIHDTLLEDWQKRRKTDRFNLEYAGLFCQLRLFDSAWQYYVLLQPVLKDIRPAYDAGLGEYYFMQGYYEESLRHFEKAHDKVDDNGLKASALIGMAKVNLALERPIDAQKFARTALLLAKAGQMNAVIRDSYDLISRCYEKLHIDDSADGYFRKYIQYKDNVLSDQLKGRIASFEYEQKIILMGAEAGARELQLKKESLWRKSLVIGILMISILALVSIRVILLREKSEEEKKTIAENMLRIQLLEGEKKQAEWQHQKTELELKALQAQMNPHFIFNCLNSINNYIIHHQSAEAADYLTKFSRLTRMVLENSGRQHISLEEELKGLKWYMDLENIRFDHPFTYTIQEGGLDTSKLSIKPLILQPFVENAIWHGLHPLKTRKGRIEISISMINTMLRVEIKDNGVGRKKAEELKLYANTKKVSLGIKLTEKRIALADNSLLDSVVLIEDIIEEDRTIGGTSVQLTVAVEQL